MSVDVSLDAPDEVLSNAYSEHSGRLASSSRWGSSRLSLTLGWNSGSLLAGRSSLMASSSVDWSLLSWENYAVPGRW